ncbi:carbonic anhydrase 2-like isoform X2 [Pecten maximus]|nr:carbonic anhydrase 2-like isoform X2 [Pecten maximus]XP_033754385.1 carbonic anhydrase 2-like isoform X2 [Pecten maximus]XP_033754386.1 carbonic anhydrase 2-like isoform X2 [Pecten maximus]XP_033754387.1 carbonic anhydrase 2-like isoform X2 [Pecten maximus]
MTQTWGYGNNNGPLKWYQFYAIAKEGKRQSPIDIVTAKAEYDPELPSRPFLVNYQCEKNMELENNGHSVKAQMKERSELSGGPLKGIYLLEQFHLHWGAENGKGSEHTIDGEKYDAELHLVHYNSKYGSFAKAADKEDGLAVFGFMVKVGKSHEGFEKISNDLQNVMAKGKKSTLDSFNPRCLFNDPSSYWTYMGSLTTPPLYESVIWIVFKSPLEISQQQMDSLRSLKDSDGDKIVNNYRPPLPVGDRIVNCSFH